MNTNSRNDVENFGYNCGKTLRQKYGDKGAEIVKAQAQRVQREATQIMAALYGSQHRNQISSIIIESMRKGYIA